MAYVSRLLEDIGVSFGPRGTAGAAVHEPGHTADAAPAADVSELEETVTMADTGPDRGPVAGRLESPEPHTLAISAVEDESAAKPAARRSYAGERVEAMHVEAREEGRTASGDSEPAGIPPIETPEARIMRTLAVVGEWTAGAIPSETREVTPASGDSPQLTTRRLDGFAEDVDAFTGEVVIRSDPTEPATPASGVPSYRSSGPGEAEAVSVNLSIGAIELTVEAPEPPAATSSRAETPRQGPAAPDAQARLRRHYIRPSIGGW